jgi:hypothetical protein
MPLISAQLTAISSQLLQYPITNNQAPINNQYSITKQKTFRMISLWVFGHWLLGIIW